MIAGADDFVTIAEWGRQKRAWLAKIPDLTNRIPLHDRFNAIFRAIKPAEAAGTPGCVSGCLVTIDAIGCQTEITEKIVQGGAAYVLAVKGNQPTLFEGIADFFVGHMDDDFARVKVSRHETKAKGHGRIEPRTYTFAMSPRTYPVRPAGRS